MSPGRAGARGQLLEGRRAPQGLDAEDRLALGLTASHLAYLVVGGLAAYALISGALPGFLKYPAATIVLVAAAALAWGRLEHRPLDLWVWLAFRFYLRPRRSPAPAVHLATGDERDDPTASPFAAPRELAPEEKEEDSMGEELGEARILSLPGATAPREVLSDEAPAPVERSAVPVFIGATQRIVFFSLKGGVGKTTLATEVAAMLARDARHRATVAGDSERLRVALLDVDMGSANVSMKLGLTHPTLWDLVVDPDPDGERIEDCLLEHEDSGLRVLLGPPRAVASTESRSLATQRVAQVLSHLDERNYHFVFIDMSSEINDMTTYLLEAAHVIYYVLTPTAAGVQDTYRGVETLRRMGHRRKLRFVLNQSRGGFDADEMLGDLGGTLAATVLRDDAFLVAEDAHRPASLEGSGDARRSIAELATAIFPSFVDSPARRSVWQRLRQRLG
jgi:MinD-like ATPase involved in chromosome partitioning or flagellar assembly